MGVLERDDNLSWTCDADRQMPETVGWCHLRWECREFSSWFETRSTQLSRRCSMLTESAGNAGLDWLDQLEGAQGNAGFLWVWPQATRVVEYDCASQRRLNGVKTLNKRPWPVLVYPSGIMH